jgi:REP element-mobilizing transposase RayT
MNHILTVSSAWLQKTVRNRTATVRESVGRLIRLTLRYLITFVCYGTHLHGDSGTVDRRHNLPGSRVLETNLERAETEAELMDQKPYVLDSIRRTAVLESMREVCLHRGWSLLAAHVRSTHVHVIVEADAKPEKIMNDFKSYASRSLNRLGCDTPNRKRWAHHGSTRWLFEDENVRQAIRYVVEEQGEPMAVFVTEEII